MRLIECSRHFILPPTSSGLHAFLQPLVQGYLSKPIPQQVLSEQDFACFMRGMGAMTNDTKVVQPLLKTMISILANWKGVLQPPDAQSCLQGLKGFDTNHPLTIDFVKALNRHLLAVDFPVDNSSVGALCGMQRMDNAHPDIEELFAYACNQYVRYEGNYQARAIGNALLGFRNKRSIAGAPYFLLRRLINDISDIISDPNTTALELNFLSHRLSAVTPNLHINLELQNKIDKILTYLKHHCKDLQLQHVNQVSYKTSAIEIVAQDSLLKRIRKDGRLGLSKNEHLHGFEADIVLRIPVSQALNKKHDNAIITLNIEIDGPYHSLAQKLFLDHIRDEALHYQGVTVIRLNFKEVAFKNISLSYIMSIAIEKNPSLETVLGQFIARESDFEIGFTKGKRAKGNNRCD